MARLSYRRADRAPNREHLYDPDQWQALSSEARIWLIERSSLSSTSLPLASRSSMHATRTTRYDLKVPSASADAAQFCAIIATRCFSSGGRPIASCKLARLDEI